MYLHQLIFLTFQYIHIHEIYTLYRYYRIYTRNGNGILAMGAAINEII